MDDECRSRRPRVVGDEGEGGQTVKKVYFALFAVLIIGSCYLLGRETGRYKGDVAGFDRGFNQAYRNVMVTFASVHKGYWIKLSNSKGGTFKLERIADLARPDTVQEVRP